MSNKVYTDARSALSDVQPGASIMAGGFGLMATPRIVSPSWPKSRFMVSP